MGFLLGAFGKMSAGRLKHQLQAKQMRIQSKLNRATRQANNMEKQLESQKKMYLNSLTFQKNFADMGISLAAKSQFGDDAVNAYLAGGLNATMIGDNDDLRKKVAAAADFITQSKGYNEMNIAQQKQMIEDKFNNMKDMILEPLRMEEESLKDELEQCKTEFQLADEHYKACQEMEKDGAKEMKPQYTAGG